MKESLAWLEFCKSMSPTIVEACTQTPATGDPGALVKALTNALPEWAFRHALARGGWYRLGGLVTAQGEAVTDNLEQWVEKELDARDGDLGALAEDYGDQGWHATRLVGKTHYLTAQTGDEVDDFLQLEIEELQEMRAHKLFANQPASIEELVDPRTQQAALPLGLPFYKLRRLQHMGGFLARMRAQKPEPAPIHRMLEDWASSSAGQTSRYDNHWVIATREHLDRYHQSVFRAQPIATLIGTPPEFAAPSGTQGMKLQEALVHFDRQAGYPMAWYFHMLTTHAVPHWVAQSVIEDTLTGFAYLPEQDIAVVRRWLHQPYTL